MSLADIIITSVIICALAAAVMISVRNKKRGGGCSCGCDSCQNTLCKGKNHSKDDVKDKTLHGDEK